MTSFCKNLDPDNQPCGVEINWQEVNTPNGIKKRPFELNGQQHKCPYWKPKKNFGQFSQVAKQVEQEISNRPPSTFTKGDTLGRIAELETQYYNDKKEFERRLGRAEGAIQALVKELSFKKGTDVADTKTVEYSEEIVEE